MNYSNNDVALLKEENEKLKRENEELKRAIALQEFRIPLNELIVGGLIGSGGFGEVFVGEWHGQAVAIKKLKANHIGQEPIDNFVKEARTHMRLRHKHVVLLMGIAREREHEDKDLMIVMEYMKHGSLAYLLFKQRVQLQRHQIIKIALDVAKGLNYLHSLNPKIIHRDLKCENILLYQNKSRAKISDFGTARQLNPDSKTDSDQGTVFYMAPEMLGRKRYDEKVDVYAFGIVLFAMARNEILPVLEEKERLARIADGVTDDEDFRQLISDCCRTDPNNRLNIRECLNRLKEMKKGKQENSSIVTLGIPYNDLVFEAVIDYEGEALLLKADWRGIKVAVKKFNAGVVKSYVHEERIMRKLRHKHIVMLLGHTTDTGSNEKMLVLEHLRDGYLAYLLHLQKATLSCGQMLRIALDVAKALDYMHSQTPKIIHRDIMSDKIMIYNLSTAESLAPNEYMDTPVGTFGFMAPEIHLGKKYNEKADVYSFGVLLLEIATKTRGLGAYYPDQMKNKIEEALNKSPTLNVTQFKSLVFDCCQWNPQQRPSMKECIEVLKRLRQQHERLWS